MSEYICPECGYPIHEGQRTCPECGVPLQIIDEGDNDAEETLREYLDLFKKWSTIMCYVGGVICVLWGLIGGIIMIANDMIFQGLVMLIVIGVIGAIGVIISLYIIKLIWSAGMIFINISTNVRKIKQRL